MTQTIFGALISAAFQNQISKMKLMSPTPTGLTPSFLFSRIFGALLLTAVHATAATVGPAGYTNGFGTQPPATDWATLSIAGAPTDTYNPDAVVNASVSAISVAARTVVDAANPPPLSPERCLRTALTS